MLSITNGYYAPADPGNIANSAPSMHPVTNQVGQDHSPAQYQSANHFYPDPQSTNLPQHTPAGMPQYDNTVYNNGADMKPNVEAQLQAELQQHNAPQGQPAPPAFSAFPTQNGYQVTAPQAGPAAWRDFTQGVMTNLPSGSEYAQTLMALQNHAHASKDGTPDMQTTTTMNMAALGGMQMSPQDGGHMQTWPLIHFGPSGGSVGGQ